MARQLFPYKKMMHAKVVQSGDRNKKDAIERYAERRDNRYRNTTSRMEEKDFKNWNGKKKRQFVSKKEDRAHKSNLTMIMVTLELASLVPKLERTVVVTGGRFGRR